MAQDARNRIASPAAAEGRALQLLLRAPWALSNLKLGFALASRRAGSSPCAPFAG